MSDGSCDTLGIAAPSTNTDTTATSSRTSAVAISRLTIVLVVESSCTVMTNNDQLTVSNRHERYLTPIESILNAVLEVSTGRDRINVDEHAGTAKA
jgi:hypothetical protein